MKAVNAVIFWLIMGSSVVLLWWAVRGKSPGEWLPEALLVGGFVLLTRWGLNRVPLPRRKAARVMLDSGLGAVAGAGFVLFRLQMLRRGYFGREASIEIALGSLLFIVCTEVVVTPSQD